MSCPFRGHAILYLSEKCSMNSLNQNRLSVPIFTILNSERFFNIIILLFFSTVITCSCSNQEKSNDPFIIALLVNTSPTPETDTVTNRDYRYLFVTQTGHNGDFGGIDGADDYCNAQIPNSLSAIPHNLFKAMLSAGTNRRATVTPDIGDGQVDWVFKPSREYRRDDGTILFTSSANALIDFSSSPLDHPFVAGGSNIWTGLQPNWSDMGNSLTCNNWTDSSSSFAGETGESGKTSYSAIHYTPEDCSLTDHSTNSLPLSLLCIEQ